MCHIKMALLQTVLHREKLEFSRVPPNLCVLQAGGSDLNDTCFSLRVLLKQDKAEAIYAGISHGVE